MSSRTSPILIAIVDDDTNLRRSLDRLLRAAGMQAVTYGSAEEFLTDAQHPRFDCLVLDIQLGGMSGIELAKLLSAAGGSTPFIYVTAHDAPEVRESAEASGCAAYFRKTDPGSEVIRAIRQCAGEAG
jgi:FixJ family two-component response regulator